MRRSKYQGALLALIISCYTASTSKAQRRPKDKILDRKVFVITMEEQSDKKKKQEPFEDELSFRSNKIGSQHMLREEGFQSGEYVIYEKDSVLEETQYKFEGINKNSKDMSLKWMGSVYGGQIEGTAVVSKNGKVKEEYTFKGALKERH